MRSRVKLEAECSCHMCTASPALRAVLVEQDHAALRMLQAIVPDGPRDAAEIASAVRAIEMRLGVEASHGRHPKPQERAVVDDLSGVRLRAGGEPRADVLTRAVGDAPGAATPDRLAGASSGAATSATVDWSGWLGKSAQAQRETWARYRATIKAESDEALSMNYSRLNMALWGRSR